MGSLAKALRAVMPFGVVITTASVVAFLGLRLAEGDPSPPGPTREVIPVPSDIPVPSFDALEFAAPIDRSVTIEGKTIQVPEVLSVTRGWISEGIGLSTRVSYQPDRNQPATSWVILNGAGLIQESSIRPEDSILFQPLLAHVSSLPSPSGAERPTAGGRDLPLTVGMTAVRVVWNTHVGQADEYAWLITLRYGDGVSRLYVDDKANALKVDIRLSHVPVFAPILAVLTQ
jgi:hypothetical protein